MIITRLRRALPGRRILLVPAVVVALIASATVTFAYFRSTGSGAGSSAAGSLQPVTVIANTGTPSSLLFPGASADVVITLSNPNAFAVTLTMVSGNGTITADGSHPGCTTTGVTFTNQTGLSINVPAGASNVDLPGAASMGATSSSGCQGATFNIPVSITVKK